MFVVKGLYFSFLTDSSTDPDNVEDEVVALLYCRKDDATEAIKSCARYLSVQVPKKQEMVFVDWTFKKYLAKPTFLELMVVGQFL